MPNVTEHTAKVSTWSVNPLARESSREKLQDRQTDERTDRHTGVLSKTTFFDVLKGCTS